VAAGAGLARRCAVTTGWSDAPFDKLEAAINHSVRSGDLLKKQPGYIFRCLNWFMALTPEQQTTALAAIEALSKHGYRKAEGIVAELPPAPPWPL